MQVDISKRMERLDRWEIFRLSIWLRPLLTLLRHLLVLGIG